MAKFDRELLLKIEKIQTYAMRSDKTDSNFATMIHFCASTINSH